MLDPPLPPSMPQNYLAHMHIYEAAYTVHSTHICTYIYIIYMYIYIYNIYVYNVCTYELESNRENTCIHMHIQGDYRNSVWL